MRVLDSFQAVAGPLPERDESPPRIRVIGESTHPGYTQQTIRYEALPEDPIPAYPLIADGWGKRPAVLALHPADTLGKGIPAGLSERPNRGYAHELALRGLVVLAADYVYMGDSQGDPYELGYASGTMKGNYNHIRGVDSLASLPSVDAGRIGVIGHSSRGHNALFVALFDKRFRALVTSCEFDAFAKYKNGYLSGWSSKKYMPRIAAVYDKEPALMPFEFTEVLGAVAPRAVFISAPSRDSKFKVSGVKDRLRSARPVYEKIYSAGDRLVAMYPGCGHDFPPEIRARAYEFPETWLPSAAD